MTRESTIICRNQFKNTDAEVSKAEFNRKMALLISRMDNQVLENGEETKPAEKPGCLNK